MIYDKPLFLVNGSTNQLQLCSTQLNSARLTLLRTSSSGPRLIEQPLPGTHFSPSEGQEQETNHTMQAPLTFLLECGIGQIVHISLAY